MEMFGGYSWYPLLPHIADASLGMSRSQGVSFQSRGKKNDELVQNLQQLDQPTRAWAMHYYASEADKRAIYHPDFAAGLSDSRRHFGKQGRWEPVDYLGHDRDYYFPFSEMLRKADRFTMARSVEGRVPFAAPLVRRLVETFSWADLVSEKRLKACLRDAFRDILPMGVIERPKHGFNVPVDHWLTTGWRGWLENTFSSNSELFKHGIISSNALESVELLLGNAGRLSGHTIFCFMTLNRWLEGI